MDQTAGFAPGVEVVDMSQFSWGNIPVCQKAQQQECCPTKLRHYCLTLAPAPSTVEYCNCSIDSFFSSMTGCVRATRTRRAGEGPSLARRVRVRPKAHGDGNWTQDYLS